MTTLSIQDLLTQYGLICHSFAFNDLPKHVQDALCDNNNQTTIDSFSDTSLSLIANVGPTFWAALTAANATSKIASTQTDCVDTFSVQISHQLLEAAGLTDSAEILYPGNAPAPLMQLGELAQWSTPSPLGLGLHPTYGPWIAYRALLKTMHPLCTNELENSRPALNRVAWTSPCVACETTPCVSACPANAVSFTERFDIARCADYRVEPNSSCTERCHARNACPVGIEYRYSDEQHAYHMTHALQALISWAAKS